MIRRDVVGCWVLVAALVAGCSYNQATERPELVLTSKDTERELGEREAKKVEATMGLVEDPELNDYVATIGKRLVEQAPSEGFAFAFHVVNMPEPNAFALPGGNIYVSRGILALANSEDELAGVIGHEVAHVFGRHTGHRITLGAPLTLATGIAATATGIVSQGLANVIGGIGGATQSILLSPYDRHQERQADEMGLELAAKAGWDPAALSHILHSLEREEDAHGGGGLAFFASHPRTPQRVRDTKAHAAELERGPGKPIVSSTAAFYDKLDGLIIGHDPAQGIFDEEHFVQPDLGLAVDFPKGWKTQNSPDQVVGASEDEKAVAILRMAAEGDDPMEVATKAAKDRNYDPAELIDGVEINGLKAARSQIVEQRSGLRGTTKAQATWIAHGGIVYSIVVAATGDEFDARKGDLMAISDSFRRATAKDRSRVKADRLRIVKAKSGETMAQLVERVGSSWTAQEAAIANAVTSDEALEGGRLVKVVKRESY